jgi:N-acetylglucosaminyl-diphospho-decaprenol L-rhamnosyltransferase
VRIGLATIQYGRRLHLARQAEATRRLGSLDSYVIVSMEPQPPRVRGADVIHRPTEDRNALPLSAARNAAIDRLSDLDLVVMLDVDCIPDPGILDGYRRALEIIGTQPVLLAGPVGYLDALTPSQRALSPADRCRAQGDIKREAPSRGVRREPRMELFWSLSYAVRPETHHRIGGFDEQYVGYGAEDTDYAFRAKQRGAELWSVADAWAYHQPHPPVSADAAAVTAIAANVNRFHREWGIWPMTDWIRQSVARADVRWDADGALVPAESISRTAPSEDNVK